MNEPENGVTRTPEETAVIEDLLNHIGITEEVVDLVKLPKADWPDELTIYYLYRKDRFGRIFYQYVCVDGEVYSPFAPDALERLFKRVLESRRFELNALQMANILLIYKRPEPIVTLISDLKNDLAPASCEALDMYYGIENLEPQLTVLDEDHKLIFWTLNVRRETLKRWIAYIAPTGRMRLSEDVKIELRNAREGYA